MGIAGGRCKEDHAGHGGISQIGYGMRFNVSDTGGAILLRYLDIIDLVYILDRIVLFFLQQIPVVEASKFPLVIPLDKRLVYLEIRKGLVGFYAGGIGNIFVMEDIPGQ